MRPSLSFIRKPFERDFRQLVETHQSRVFSIAFRILGDRGLSEEVAQDVFLALYRDLDRLESDAHVLAWLRRVTVHRALDAHRRRVSRIEYVAEEFHEDRTQVLYAGENCSGAQGRMYASKRLERWISSLSVIQKSVLLLRYQEGMLPAEIATTLAMPQTTVKSHLQRALKRLRSIAERETKEVANG